MWRCWQSGPPGGHPPRDDPPSGTLSLDLGRVMGHAVLATERGERMGTRTIIRAFEGQLLGPGDEAYDGHREIWNALVDRRPGLIARCTSAQDVAAAVRFGRDSGLEIAVKCGGHGILGLC